MKAFAASGVALLAQDLMALRGLENPHHPKEAASHIPGPFPARQKGQGHDLADLRAYVHGDDLRHIDPAATARTGEIHVRQFRQDRDRSLILIADFRRPMLWGVKKQLRSHLTAQKLVRLGWDAADRGERVGMIALTGAGPRGTAASARHDVMVAIIRDLCAAHQDALENPLAGLLSDALLQVEKTFPRHARLVIASGFDDPDPALSKRLEALRERHDLEMVSIPHGLEQGLPKGQYPVTDGAIWDGRYGR